MSDKSKTVSAGEPRMVYVTIALLGEHIDSPEGENAFFLQTSTAFAAAVNC